MNVRNTPDRSFSHRIFQLDTKHLIAFDAIYSTRNLSRAARLIGTAQPTMSNLLARLRDVMDDPLFIRRSGEMMPTVRADQLIPRIRAILSDMATLTDHGDTFDPTRDNREFKLHITDIFETLVMPGLLRDAADHPGISYKLLLAPGRPIAEALESGDADVAIGMPPPNNPNLLWEAVMPIEAVAIARKGHPEIDGHITPEQFTRIGHVTIDLTPGAMANIGTLRPTRKVHRQDVVRVPLAGSVLEIVANSDLIGLAHPAQLATSPFRDRLQELDLPMPDFAQNFQMTWHKRNAEDAGIAWLMGRIRSALDDSEKARQGKRTAG